LDVYVARQPIFDRRRTVVGYELLFRDGPQNAFPRVDGDHASRKVIGDTLLVFGLDSLSAGVPLWVNATRRVLVDGLATALPPGAVVVEVLETVEADDEVVAACRQLRAAGYRLALDDYVFETARAPLLDLVDFVKVDFRALPAGRRTAPSRPHRLAALAEKVEDPGEVEEAIRGGFELFQGFFFQRPQMMHARQMPAFKLAYLEFLREVNRPDLDFGRVEQSLRREASLSVKLLRYLNSAAFGLHGRVTSLRQAIVLLGERAFRRWASLVAVAALGEDCPAELVRTCMVRARFCELLGEAADAGDLFLAGMLSAVDAMTGRPRGEVVAELALSPALSAALRGEDTREGRILALVLAWEQGRWDRVEELRRAERLDPAVPPLAFARAVAWAQETAAVGC